MAFSTYYFYPRSPCGERRLYYATSAEDNIFLSTFPLRGTSTYQDLVALGENISIHVPLAGNVYTLDEIIGGEEYFYPRSPCGERPHSASV